MTHVPSEHLADYLDGTLPPQEVREVEAHLAECATCRQEATAVSRLSRGEVMRRRARVALPAVGLAAVLALLFVPTLLDRQTDVPDVLRGVRPSAGGESLVRLQPHEPAIQIDGDVARVRLSWEGAGVNLSYRVTVADEAGVAMWTTDTSATEVTLPSEVIVQSGRLYFWYVDTSLPDGQTATTGVQELRIP